VPVDLGERRLDFSHAKRFRLSFNLLKSSAKHSRTEGSHPAIHRLNLDWTVSERFLDNLLIGEMWNAME
jgi:hypothetical protein